MTKLTRKQIRESLDTLPIDSILLGASTGARLTPKQKEFARKIANGTSQVDAYRETRDTKATKATQRNNAYRLAKRDDVKATIEAFKVAREFQEQHTAAQLRAFVIQQLTQHAIDEDNRPSDKLTALKLLGTVAEVGAFVHQTAKVDVSASADIRSRLMDKLKLIGAGVSEGVYTEKPEESADSLMAELQERPTPEEEGQPPHGENPDGHPDDPTHSPPAVCDVGDVDKVTHSIPLTQSPTILTGTISSDNSGTLSNQVVTGEENLHEPYNVRGKDVSETYTDIEDGEFTDTPPSVSE